MENNGLVHVGGLQEVLARVQQVVQGALFMPEKFGQYGLEAPKGVLLYGPPGTGKTLVVRALAAESKAKLFVINGPEIMTSYYGESEAKVCEVFSAADAAAPSIIFIDEIDAIAPRRCDMGQETEKRVISTLLTLLDGLTRRGRVVLLAATNRPDSLDPALRRPGRLDREIEIGVPSASERAEILAVHLAKVPNNLSAEALHGIAATMHGYVGADIAAICSEAGLAAADAIEQCDKRMHQWQLQAEDLLSAIQRVRPSAMREVAIEVPQVLWSDIGGQQHIKQQLQEAVEWPLKHPSAFVRMGIRPPKGLLLFGPPGCSKTLMAKALATEAGLNFIAVKGPELFSKWVGESEKAVKEVFRKARLVAPAILFFDEIDALAVKRGDGKGGDGIRVAERVLSQLLTELDGIEPLKSVVVVAATNRPDLLDKALLRPGRLDRLIYAPPPNLEDRHKILTIHTRSIPLDEDVDLRQLAVKTEAYSGAELACVCREAALKALQENLDSSLVSFRHFQHALEDILPRIPSDLLKIYESFHCQ